ncbi:MAG: LytR C-terminal domain-containing protein [candidate division Zixibacteria bacterium]|nr:LytR C-terminal domain-containing protein [candidate division Zixibacteria bacterium]
MELAIVAIFALVAIYAASFAIRITHGFSKTIEAPEYVIRMQILNGCGTDGVANQVAKVLPVRVKLPLEVKVIDVDDFDSYDISETFIISRLEDTDAAEILAVQLGLDPDKVVYQNLENNYRTVSATLVLGKDYEATILKPSED